ncbi:mechanosensitive ion channel domain-containing protein [uncultured Lacinutrix sp.]|uniref:mechanosensitive ion channel family protein n=1 Tax=uncultured Lacinutrix sp. TaxID=574032 RepID=UPI00261DB5AD|nr:mechanosensitive ion channel domain-containing protein [uncultured Lacinutrix sp.]
MSRMTHWFYDYLLSVGASEVTAKYLNMLALLLALLIITFVIDFIVRRILLNVFSRFAARSKSNFDDILVKNKVPRNIAHIIPLIIALKVVPSVFYDFQGIENVVEKALKVFGIVLALWIARSVLNTLKDYFKTIPRLKDKPVDSYIQVFMIFVWIAGFVLAFAIVADMSVWKFMTGLGAISAVIILVFKDTILGFVASIQVSINDMVRIGDWITFEKYGADGDVIEINLATVKVQNFDKTITTIPTYALISESFKNWRGMTNSDGRRIKRALIIKQSSIKYLTPEKVDALKSINLISNYLKERQEKITTHNKVHDIDKTLLLNGRNLTNIGVFRKYIDAYVKQHTGINNDMMIMVRQLPPTAQGIPLEVYAFSADKIWKNYEYIIADVFDHILAAVPYFDLELFELPSEIS